MRKSEKKKFGEKEGRVVGMWLLVICGVD